MRSEVRIDLGALRRNVRTLLGVLDGSELWAVVKANAYGHGDLDCARAALDAGAAALCVATVAEGVRLREAFRDVRVLVMGPHSDDDVGEARAAGLALVVSSDRIPEGVEVHVKLDTGMGRWGLSELPSRAREVAGLMTHFATADSDLDFARLQLARFLELTEPLAHLCRHTANSAAALRLPEARLDACRCGIALYGVSPFDTDPAQDGLEPVLSWRSEVAQVKRLRPGESTGYGRRFLAERETWVGVVPVGYADGFRRDMTGADVLLEGERCRVVGTVSMDALAIELPGERPAGTPVTLVGDGVLLEEHARVAHTIAYELVCGIDPSPARTSRVVVET